MNKQRKLFSIKMLPTKWSLNLWVNFDDGESRDIGIILTPNRRFIDLTVAFYFSKISLEISKDRDSSEWLS
jgi:hypothetical protein